MADNYNLERFLKAQDSTYQTALSEIKSGRKRSHWMWYIFPQIKGLGFSTTSQFYAIEDLNEAEQFLKHELLGTRLINICGELVKLQDHNAGKIFGSPDDLKLKSCMTLFAALNDTNPVFEIVLKKFFNGTKDDKTLLILQK